MDTEAPAPDAGQRRALTAIREREDAAFRARVPGSLALTVRARTRMPGGVPMQWMAGFYRTPVLWVTHGHGPHFTDVDGNHYLDFDVGDMSTVLGYAHPRLTETVAAQAARGVQPFPPSEPALAVCEQLRLRFGLPQWQFSLSASNANTEALRIARVATGRRGVPLFAGKHHGQLQETLWTDDGSGLVPVHRTGRTAGHRRRRLQRPRRRRAGPEPSRLRGGADRGRAPRLRHRPARTRLPARAP